MNRPNEYSHKLVWVDYATELELKIKELKSENQQKLNIISLQDEEKIGLIKQIKELKTEILMLNTANNLMKQALNSK